MQTWDVMYTSMGNNSTQYFENQVRFNDKREIQNIIISL